MPDSREFDVRWLPDLALPYDVATKELSDGTPRLVDGANMYVTVGGKLAVAPGMSNLTGGAAQLLGRVDNIALYETMDSPPKMYLMNSEKDSSTGLWSLGASRLDTGSPTPVGLPNLRGVQHSVYPHQFLVSRGLCYIKAFPSNSEDFYGTIVFDGSTGSFTATKYWGLPSPTNPAILVSMPSSTWTASVGSVTVNYGWKYTYCYRSSTGHISNHAPMAVAPNTSNTGPFTNRKPPITVVGPADTTNIPYIDIFRTTDGGGTFYYLDTIANTGAPVTYEDNHRESINTNNPKLDAQLDTANIAPSLTSNTTPPPYGEGLSLGSSLEPSSPLAYFARRVWFSIRNRVYFSGQEEILNGIPEESFPAPNGILGNYYRLQSHPTQVKATKKYLYLLSTNEIGYISGQDRTNLTYDTVVTDIGGSKYPKAIASFRDTLFFLSADFQIYAMTGLAAPQNISLQLGDTLKTLLSSTTKDVCMEVWNRDGNTWLLVSVADLVTASAGRVFVYDLNRNIWFTPWTKNITTMAFGRTRESEPKQLVCTLFDGSASYFAMLDLAVRTDLGTPYGTAPFFVTNLFTLPAGNHINELRKHGHTPMVSYAIVERTKAAGDAEPTVKYRLDEFGSSPAFTTGTPYAPPYEARHTSYHSDWFPIQLAAKRVQISVADATASGALEIQNIGFVFASEQGA